MPSRKPTVKVTELKADLFKALSNSVRIQILNELRDGELSVTELRDRLEVELPNVSQQLSILKSKNLVSFRKEGKVTYYFCSDNKIFKILDVARDLMNANLSKMQKAMNASEL